MTGTYPVLRICDFMGCPIDLSWVTYFKVLFLSLHPYFMGDEIAQRYGAGLRVRIPAGTRNYSHHRVQAGFSTHPASYPMATRGSYPVDKAAGVRS